MSGRQKKYLPSLTNIYNAHAIVHLSVKGMEQYLDYIEDYIRQGGKFSWQDIREFSFDAFNIYIHDAPPLEWDKPLLPGVYLAGRISADERKISESYCKVRILNRAAPLSCKPPYINREILDALKNRGINISWQRLFTFNASLMTMCLCIARGGYDAPFKDERALGRHIAETIARSYNETFVKNCLDNARAQPLFSSRYNMLIMHAHDHLKNIHDSYKKAKGSVERWRPPKA